ncbi:hypothetical protein [Microbulbifer sp. NBRC 101763]|uniref:hypothetical protein n=1 Tax=Microbulbifer sp. NBRC 101763 TaxID=1113820 RepID=UPI003341A897
MWSTTGQWENIEGLFKQAIEADFPAAYFHYGSYLLEISDKDHNSKGIEYLNKSANSEFPLAL